MSTASAGVVAYKSGDYAEAVRLYDIYLSAHNNDKIGYANRAAALGALGRHEDALVDAGMCLEIDWLWAKGHLRKAQALVGLGARREALEVLLDASKCCEPSSVDILTPLTVQLNKELGGYIGGLSDVSYRRAREPFCVNCGQFQADLPSLSFISCNSCHMVRYCCAAHQVKDKPTHRDVCAKLSEAHDQDEKSIQVLIKWPNETDPEMQGAPFNLIARYPEGDQPLVVNAGLMFLNQQEAMALHSWDAWFSLPKQRKIFDSYRTMHLNGLSVEEMKQQMNTSTFRDMIAKLPPAVAASITPEMLAAQHSNVNKTPEVAEANRVKVDKTLRKMRRALTEVFTDPLTAFHAMQAANVLRDKFFCAPTHDRTVIELHVVGAEPRSELFSRSTFCMTLRALFGEESTHLHVHYIGCLLPSAPDQKQSFDQARYEKQEGFSSTLFGGTYQDFLVSPAYAVPDCIVAFHPGLYDPTYPWLPVLAHAIAKSIPFVATCFHKQDYADTKDFVTGSCYGMAPNIIVDSQNPFASTWWYQATPGDNVAKARNAYILVMHGGGIGALIPRIIAGDAVSAQLQHAVSQTSVLDFDVLRKDLVKLSKAGAL